MECLRAWPEPVVPVQYLSESGIRAIPERYVKGPSDRPFLAPAEPPASDAADIPVIDLSGLFSGNPARRSATLGLISDACCKWGFFQVVNHGVSHELMTQACKAWREFFQLPLEEKQLYANSPATYEGYGSRLGVEEGIKLDWSDYFFLHYLPQPLRDENKWPRLPLSCREVTAEYGNQLIGLCVELMKALSVNLGLEEDYLHKAFGGDEEIGACMRVNFYPKCPQPDLTLGLSSHSDPGGMTLILCDEHISGLQVHCGDRWIAVKPTPNAFIVNIGDQLQILSNATYKSVEHRVVVNSVKDRLSLAFFYNPNGNILVRPAKELVSKEKPALYPAMTFNHYRLVIRTKGPCGKSQVNQIKHTSHCTS